jgi:hypothetical protein
VHDGQLTAENLVLEVGDVSFVYPRFDNKHTPPPPLVMLQRFAGNLDQADPFTTQLTRRSRTCQ